MTTLLVDIGNTRIKWALLRRGSRTAPAAGGRLGRMHGAEHAGWRAAQFGQYVLTAAPRPERVVAVSVAPESVWRAFAQACRLTWQLQPERIASERRRAGVVNGYRQPWRLGADRWVALLGARALLGAGRAVCVIDAGTALTLDLLDGRGHHLGGAIVPGPELMVASLLDGTGGIRRRAGATPDDALRARFRRASRAGAIFARDTQAGLAAGAVYAAAGAVQAMLAQASARLGQPPALLLTGGAAGSLASLVRTAAGRRGRVVPDLVLRGLAAASAKEWGST